jgi:hypothetical protein
MIFQPGKRAKMVGAWFSDDELDPRARALDVEHYAS